MVMMRTLSVRVYRGECLADASRRFASLCDVTWTREGGEIDLQIQPLPGAPEATVHEFLNYLLAASLESQLT